MESIITAADSVWKGRTKYVFGIDPGTGSSSACGIALLNKESGEVVWTAALYPDGDKPTRNMKPHHRIKKISDKAITLLEHALEFTSDSDSSLFVSIEAFVIKGKGGVTLERLKGAILCRVPFEIEVVEVYNSVVKKIAGGKGSANKEQIGEKLKELLPKSKNYIQILINEKRWDEIDAIGIAYSAVDGGVSL